MLNTHDNLINYIKDLKQTTCLPDHICVALEKSRFLAISKHISLKSARATETYIEKKSQLDV